MSAKTSIALPSPLMAWLREEAVARDMSINALIGHIIERERTHGHASALRSLEVRVAILEKRVNACESGVSK